MKDLERKEQLLKLEKIAVDSNNSLLYKGKALKEIKEKELYLPHWKFFSPYLVSIGLGHGRGHQMVYLVEVCENLQNAGIIILPSNIRYSYIIHDLNPQDQVKVWKEAVNLAGGSQPSERNIYDSLYKHTGKKPDIVKYSTPVKKKPVELNYAHIYVVMAITELGKIDPGDIGKKEAWAMIRKWLDENE